MCSLCNVLIQPPTAGGTEVDRLERQLTLAGLGTTPAFDQAQVGAAAAGAAHEHSQRSLPALVLRSRSFAWHSLPQNMTVFPPAKHDALGLEVRHAGQSGHEAWLPLLWLGGSLALPRHSTPSGMAAPALCGRRLGTAATAHTMQSASRVTTAPTPRSFNRSC